MRSAQPEAGLSVGDREKPSRAGSSRGPSPGCPCASRLRHPQFPSPRLPSAPEPLRRSAAWAGRRRPPAVGLSAASPDGLSLQPRALPAKWMVRCPVPEQEAEAPSARAGRVWWSRWGRVSLCRQTGGRQRRGPGTGSSRGPPASCPNGGQLLQALLSPLGTGGNRSPPACRPCWRLNEKTYIRLRTEGAGRLSVARSGCCGPGGRGLSRVTRQ